ncbi:MAG: hypothetical protein WC175_04440 [Candidatus Dojkabacteria bacterium]|jgi:hypothetical protein
MRTLPEKKLEDMTYVELCEYYEGSAELPCKPGRPEYSFGFAY